MSTRVCWELLKKTATRWDADNGRQKGAALAYYTIFSLAPLALIAMVLAGLAVGNAAVHDFVTAKVQALIGPESALIFEDLMVKLSQPGASTTANAAGVVVLLVGASGVVGELQHSLNQIWRTPDSGGGLAAHLERRLLSLAFVLAAGFLLLVSVIVCAVVAALEKYLSLRLALPVFALQAANLAVCFSISALLFAMIYKLLPAIRVLWHDVWAGALATAFLFTIGNALLGIYLGKFGGTSSYGVAGAVVLVLVWTFYCAQILYLGAEFTVVYAENRKARR
jgi:membrane protein